MSVSILFTGYAPVHFACFEPIYWRLTRSPEVAISLSGGLRSKDPAGEWIYDSAGMYAPFAVPEGAVLTVDEIRERHFDLLVAANTKKIAPDSFDRSIEIFHGMSFRNRAIRPANGANDHYFVLGPYMRRRLAELGILATDDPRVVEVGFPKTDRLLDGTLDRAEVLRAHGLDGRRPIILYAPTGAKRNSLETMGEEVIRRLAAAEAFDLLVKPHDHPKHRIDWFARLAPLQSSRVRLVRQPDVIPTLFAADLLITDASSVANEYALLDRPIVFLDVPELLAAAGGEGSALDLETWGRRGGEVVAGPADIVAAVERGLADPGARSEVRREMVRDLFYNPGRATTAALEWLRTQLGLRERLSSLAS